MESLTNLHLSDQVRPHSPPNTFPQKLNSSWIPIVFFSLFNKYSPRWKITPLTPAKLTCPHLHISCKTPNKPKLDGNSFYKSVIKLPLDATFPRLVMQFLLHSALSHSHVTRSWCNVDQKWLLEVWNPILKGRFRHFPIFAKMRATPNLFVGLFHS
jgi:hypothetical protein